MKIAKILLLMIVMTGCGLGDQMKNYPRYAELSAGKGNFTMDTNTYFLFGNNWTVEELWGIAPSMMMLRESLIKQQKMTASMVDLSGGDIEKARIDSTRMADLTVFLGNFIFDYEDYICDEEAAEQLHRIFNKLEKSGRKMRVVMVGGNWCSDTKSGVPAVCRVLDEADYPGNIDYFRVDREKRFIDPGIEMEVTRVPHIIFQVTKKGSDEEFESIGEIIETANGSWEKNILAIFKKAK